MKKETTNEKKYTSIKTVEARIEHIEGELSKLSPVKKEMLEHLIQELKDDIKTGNEANIQTMYETMMRYAKKQGIELPSSNSGWSEDEQTKIDEEVNSILAQCSDSTIQFWANTIATTEGTTTNRKKNENRIKHYWLGKSRRLHLAKRYKIGNKTIKAKPKPPQEAA